MMDLFNQVEAPHQDGWTFNPSKDHKRLTTAMDRVMALMSDGQERTLSEIARLAKTSESGASARLRDIRKAKFRCGLRQLEYDRQADRRRALRLPFNTSK